MYIVVDTAVFARQVYHSVVLYTYRVDTLLVSNVYVHHTFFVFVYCCIQQYE